MPRSGDPLLWHGLPTVPRPRPKVSPFEIRITNRCILTMERYRIQSEAAVYFVTYSVVDWLPVFVSESACRIVTESLTFCHREKGLRVNAYVIMPTHLHAIFFDKDFDCQRLANIARRFPQVHRPFAQRFLLPIACRRASPKRYVLGPRSTATGGFGSRAATPRRSKPRDFGSRSWTTCTRILAVRGW